MQSSFYGACTGTSASKYDVWITVKENSQSITGNKSNVTVYFYLKRNDGYSASAYNLYSDQNTVKITVGGSVKVNKNLTIDTRNGTTMLLGTWTGDVSHADDGKLSLSVSAVFTMGNTGLSGGSVSGSFKCTTIPRVSTATFSLTTVNPGSVINAQINFGSSSFSHKIKWSLENKSQTNTISSGVSVASFTVPVSWTSAITDSAKGNFNITLFTYSGTTLVGKKVYSLNFVIPSVDEYKPQFDLQIQRHNENVKTDIDEYIQGISKIEVNTVNASFKYSASFKSVTVKVGSVQKKTVPAIFDLPKNGELTVSVTVKDTRGFSRTKTTTVNVCEYSPPSVNIENLQRCDSTGAPAVYGTYIKADYTLVYSSVDSKNSGALTVKYKTANGTYSSPVTLTGTSALIGDGNISINNSYDLCFTPADNVTTQNVDIVRSVSSANIPFNIKKGGRGAAFGKFSEEDNKLSVGWDLEVKGNASVEGDLSLFGSLNCESVTCTNTDCTENIVSKILYYPSLGMCFLRLRFKNTTVFTAGEVYNVAIVQDKMPLIYTPIFCYAHKNGGMQSGGITHPSGEIRVVSDTDIAAGTSIYMSGFYFTDYEN